MTLAAEDAATALRSIATKLLDAKIITDLGYSTLSEEARRIGMARTARTWSLKINRGAEVQFDWCLDKNGNDIRPTIIADLVVDQNHAIFPPFSSLVIAVELHDLNNHPVARWHVDRANSTGNVQDGPLFHLQYGGHNAENRTFDAVLKEPRWCHPPLDVGLLCEIVAANFFTERWEKDLRYDTAWCDSIQTFQKLCYTTYIKQMQSYLNASHSTALGQMWTDSWHPRV
ncbi:hypothetical protein SAMN05444678_10723 [Sphingomonas sp. YR710]|uniref:hypothetical protein n=1 Tax=Sphingomonas sp. YR710 TaxID=1882773 RepID=UPI000889E6AB|nr:hypothetical protein [Sphingomonas sp. YR710]SDC93138.1 hypothetical protein SAMN05444678_10723 [Sphingomonas sp. YR710]